MGKLGQMGGLIRGVTENWVRADEKRKRCSEATAQLTTTSEKRNIPFRFRALEGGIFSGASQSPCQLGSRSQGICHCLIISNRNFDEGLGTVHNPCPPLVLVEVHLFPPGPQGDLQWSANQNNPFSENWGESFYPLATADGSEHWARGAAYTLDRLLSYLRIETNNHSRWQSHLRAI